jgi:glycosyltransferase involved in cell wall biosynthesis
MATIIHIADYGGPYSGNFISSLLHLQEAVHKQLGLDTAFIFSKVAEGRPWLRLIQDRAIPVLFLDKDMPQLKRFQAITAIAREHDAVLLHSHFTSFDIDAAVAARRLGIKVVWHMHSDLVGKYTLKQRMKDLIKMRIVSKRWVDYVVPVSDSVAQFAKLRGALPQKIMTIYNGIDTTRLQKIDEKTQAILRHHYNISESQRVFLLFGQDPERKGVDILAKAAALLEKLGYTNMLCLIVTGERNKVVVSNMVGEAPYVKVISPVENVAELYALADCFVSASRSEAFSYAIGKAMASGLPVISSDLPHLLTIYGPAGKGFLTFRSEDAQDLAEVMVQVLKASPEELCHWGKLNRHFIEENLTVDRWCEKVIGLYRFLLNTNGAIE